MFSDFEAISDSIFRYLCRRFDVAYFRRCWITSMAFWLHMDVDQYGKLKLYYIDHSIPMSFCSSLQGVNYPTKPQTSQKLSDLVKGNWFYLASNCLKIHFMPTTFR